MSSNIAKFDKRIGELLEFSLGVTPSIRDAALTVQRQHGGITGFLMTDIGAAIQAGKASIQVRKGNQNTDVPLAGLKTAEGKDITLPTQSELGDFNAKFGRDGATREAAAQYQGMARTIAGTEQLPKEAKDFGLSYIRGAAQQSQALEVTCAAIRVAGGENAAALDATKKLSQYAVLTNPIPESFTPEAKQAIESARTDIVKELGAKDLPSAIKTLGDQRVALEKTVNAGLETALKSDKIPEALKPTLQRVGNIALRNNPLNQAIERFIKEGRDNNTANDREALQNLRSTLGLSGDIQHTNPKGKAVAARNDFISDDQYSKAVAGLASLSADTSLNDAQRQAKAAELVGSIKLTKDTPAADDITAPRDTRNQADKAVQSGGVKI